MKKVVIYPGRFQPMLPHHAEVYRRLQSSFPGADVYVATSDKVEAPKSPFNFKEKVAIISQQHDIPQDKILLAPQPYLVDSFKDKFDAENTMVIFAVGEKDDDRFPMKNVDPDTGLDMTVRGEPRPKYYQMINTLKQHPALPMSERGYIYNAPSISGLDGDVASASAFRKAFTSVEDEQQQKEVFTKYMGSFNENIFALFRNKILGDKMNKTLEDLKYLAGMITEAPVDFDEPVDTDDEEDYKPGFTQDNMLNQLGKVADSDEASKDAEAMKVKKFSKVTNVTTDDGDSVDVSGAEARALMQMFDMLSSQRGGEEQSPREKFSRAIQTTKGLEGMLKFAKAKGLVKEDAPEMETVGFDDIRAEYGIEEDGPTSSQMSDAELADYIGASEEEVRADREAAEEAADDKSRDHMYEAKCGCCGNDPCDCPDDCEGCKGMDESEEAVEDAIEETIDNAMTSALAELRKLAGI